MTYRSQPCCKVHMLPYSTARVPDVLARQIASVSASQYMALHPNMYSYSPRAVPQRNLCAMQGRACRDVHAGMCMQGCAASHESCCNYIKCNNKLEADRVRYVDGLCLLDRLLHQRSAACYRVQTMIDILGYFTPKPLRKLTDSVLGIRTKQKTETSYNRACGASQVTQATNVHAKLTVSSAALC